MKISKILLSLVIVGISNLTSAQAGLAKIPGIDASNMIDGVQTWSKNKCGKDRSAENVANYFLDCVKSLRIDFKTLPQQINVYETVANSLCNVVPNLEKCMKNITVVLKPCLKPDEKESIDTLVNVTSSMMKFVCMNEGDGIANFIAADGVNCVMSNHPEIESCANETFREYTRGVQTASPSFPRLPLLLEDSKECIQIEKFRNCVIPVLKTCGNPTPSDVVDSVFDHLGRITPCKTLLSGGVAQLNLEAPLESFLGIEIPEIPYLKEAKATVCLVGKFESLKRCANDIPYDRGECRNVEMIKDCTIDLVKECNARYILDAVDSMFGIIDHALRCDVPMPGAREMLRSDTSHASSAGLINIALLIVASTISASFL